MSKVEDKASVRAPEMPLAFIKTKWGWQVAPPGDQFVTGSYRQWGVYSEVEVEILRGLLEPGEVAIVAGGNIGAVAVPLALAGVSVLTFEPQPLLAKLLEANVALAGVQAGVRVRNAALGEADGSIKVPIIRFESQYNMGRFGKDDWEKEQAGAVEVPMVAFSSIVSAIKPRLVLLDVEGMELELLKAMGDRKAAGGLRPLLWVEADRPEQYKGLMDWMVESGYRAYWVITPLTPMGVSPDQGPWPLQASFNLLCVPDEQDIPVDGLRRAQYDDPVGNCPANWIITGVEVG